MPPLEAATLHVQEFIAHRVPRPKKNATGGTGPVFSEAIPPLPATTLDFFTKRFRGTLNGSGQPVEVDDELTPTVPDLMVAYLSGAAELIDASKKTASHLFTTQPASRFEDESIFVATKLAVMGQLGIGVMKLERESGLDLDVQTIDGKPTLTVTLHENLMLTDTTRVFKAGAFWLSDGVLVGHVSDDQQGRATDVAHYFLSAFLGFRLQRHPRIVTEGFVRTVRRFISSEVSDPETKLRYVDALNAEIHSHQAKIRPMDFINSHIDEPERPVLLQRFNEAGVPQASFTKDVTGLGRVGTRTNLKTASGITISGPVDVVHDRVSAVKVQGEERIIVRDRLTEV